ncbi:MAG: phosphoribosylanthranilate isomerase [Acidobacteriaceae bacterium]|nr:phosphoribosylanthranilate isomerase [Acidobacteriaceae bacterium]
MSAPAFIVKICGITNETDARIALDAGANALGFNFYKNSPRYIAPRRAREIAQAVSGDYLKVGIFVKASEAELLRVMNEAPLDVAQLHGDSVALPSAQGVRVWRALPAAAPAPPAYPGIEAYLLDSPSLLYGGSGDTFDWRLAAAFPHRAIIAGGLDASNVAEAIRVASPWGVDACSRLEASPGKKDLQRVRDFVRAALEAVGQEVNL